MSKRVTCCGGLEMIRDRGLPISQSLVVNRHLQTAGALRAHWGVRVPYLTPSGNISKKQGTTVFFNYCPFCGTDIQPKEPKDEKDEEVVEPPDKE